MDKQDASKSKVALLLALKVGNLLTHSSIWEVKTFLSHERQQVCIMLECRLVGMEAYPCNSHWNARCWRGGRFQHPSKMEWEGRG